LVVDDWFETGAQFEAARILIEKTGATLVGASVIIDEMPDTVQ
jgi:adenine/guanine phosphoribosyltransferase-like PRPP-binding protein